MSVIAAAVRALMKAGASEDTILEAIEDMEAELRAELAAAPADKRQARNRRYYAAHREKILAQAKGRYRDGKATEGDGKTSERSEDRLKTSEASEDRLKASEETSEKPSEKPSEEMSPRDITQPLKPSLSAKAPREGAGAQDAPPPPPDDLDPDSQPKKRKRQGPRQAKALTLIDPERMPCERNLEFARSQGLTERRAIWDEWQAFRSHHAALGTFMKDWDQAWQTWVLRWKKRAAE